MKLEELKSKIAEQDGLRVCPVCGLPFKPYRSNQKTCADPACQKKYHAQYVREYNRRRRKEQPEIVKEYRRKSMRKYRQKQRDIDERDKQLEQIEDRWKRHEDFNRKVSEYGDRYGDVQKQKILASVPKIDVSMGGDDDTVHIEDDTTGS